MSSQKVEEKNFSETISKSAEETLFRAEEKYRSIFENAVEGIYQSTPDGRFITVNPALARLLGYKSPEDLLANFIDPERQYYVHPERRAEFNRLIELQGFVQNFESQVYRKDGNPIWISTNARAVRDQHGRLLYYEGFVTDITERKSSEVLLNRAKKNFRSVFENAVEGIYQSTIEGRFIVANPACARILGYDSPEELTSRDSGCKPAFYVSPELRQKFLRQLEEDGIVKGFEYQVVRKDGSKIWVSENALAMRDHDGNVLFYEGTMEDITERKQAEQQVRFLSFHDQLTGLYNRAYFVEELRRLDTQRQIPTSIIMGDVNGFKLFNDAFGHQEGDKLLLKMATILRECCRQEDVVARLGGDEFAIFLPKTTHGEAMEITDRIKAACRKDSQGGLELSIALGAVTKEDLSQDVEFVLQEAEDRMYRNKLLEGKSFRASIMSSLRRTLFEKSYETEEHTSRSQNLAIQIAEALRLPDNLLDELALLANLHDIGKIAIPEEIILKPGHLSLEEWGLVTKHPEIGYRIANSSPEMAPIAEAILSHHEWWNGAGYPRRIFGEGIPLISRIIAAVDAYDVMVHGRQYKRAVTKHEALNELWKHAGSQFDPQIVEIFIKFFSKIKIKKFF